MVGWYFYRTECSIVCLVTVLFTHPPMQLHRKGKRKAEKTAPIETDVHECIHTDYTCVVYVVVSLTLFVYVLGMSSSWNWERCSLLYANYCVDLACIVAT